LSANDGAREKVLQTGLAAVDAVHRIFLLLFFSFVPNMLVWCYYAFLILPLIIIIIIIGHADHGE